MQAGALAAKVLRAFFGVPAVGPAPAGGAMLPDPPITPQEAVDAIVGAGLEVKTATTAVLLVFKKEINGSLDDLKHFVKQFKDLADVLPGEVIAFGERLPDLFGIDPAEIQEILEASARSAAESAGAVLKDLFDKTSHFAAGVMDEVEFHINDVARTLKEVYEETAGEIITIFVDIEKQAREIAEAIADQFEEITAQAYAELVDALGFDPEQLGRDVASFIMDGLDAAYDRTAAQAAAILADLEYQAKELAQGLKDVYNEAAEQAAAIIAELEYQADQLAEALRDVYNKIDAEVAQILRDVNYLADEVADALKDAFNSTVERVGELLHDVGYAAQQIANALKDIYNAGAQLVATILDGLGININTIINVMESVFNAGSGLLEDILEALGFDPCDFLDFLCDLFEAPRGSGSVGSGSNPGAPLAMGPAIGPFVRTEAVG